MQKFEMPVVEVRVIAMETIMDGNDTSGADGGAFGG